MSAGLSWFMSGDLKVHDQKDSVLYWGILYLNSLNNTSLRLFQCPFCSYAFIIFIFMMYLDVSQHGPSS